MDIQIVILSIGARKALGKKRAIRTHFIALSVRNDKKAIDGERIERLNNEN